MPADKTIRIFDGAVAIITGGASGIGRALAGELAKRGSEVIIADRQSGLAEKAAAEIRASGGKAHAREVDVTDYPSVERLVQETAGSAGRLDYMFNNAGIGIGGNASHYRIEDWNLIMDVNLRGVINGIQAAYGIMRRQGFGHIVNTASMAGLIPSPGAAAYAATKHAIVGLSKSLRAEAASAGVYVSVICPGVIRTPILEGGGRYGRMLIDIPPEEMRRMWDEFRPMPPETFARKALAGVAKNRAIIIAPWWWRLFWWLDRLSPSAGILLARSNFQKTMTRLGIE